MEDAIDLASYRMDRPGRPDRRRLVDDCRAKLPFDGLVNLPASPRRAASAAAIDEPASVVDRHGTPRAQCRRRVRRCRS